MELNLISSAFQNRLRTAILSALMTGDKTFSELKAITKSSDGNISIQATELEKLEFIKISKTIENKKMKTIYSATNKGIDIYLDYLDMLRKAITKE